MKYQIQWLAPTQCFIRLKQPVVTQQAVLQLRCWTRLLLKEWGKKLLEIQMEPSGFLLFVREKLDKQILIKSIAATYENMRVQKEIDFQTWVFPLLWDQTDMSDLTAHFKGDKQQIDAYQEAFMTQVLFVGFYGFLPGFVYMGGLPPTMHLPRRAEPRLKVPAGSVAVGERYVGIYPQASPGGWQLLGLTPVRLFDPGRTPAFFLSPGDQILWKSITSSDMEQWQQQNKFTPDTL